MKIQDMKRDKRVRRISISIKITQELSDWLRKHNLSATKIFVGAVEELMREKKE